LWSGSSKKTDTASAQQHCPKQSLEVRYTGTAINKLQFLYPLINLGTARDIDKFLCGEIGEAEILLNCVYIGSRPPSRSGPSFTPKYIQSAHVHSISIAADILTKA
jgi:hypothetical protein